MLMPIYLKDITSLKITGVLALIGYELVLRAY